MEKEFGPEYASVGDASFMVKYQASCYCKAVHIEVCADPVDAKICHCLTCQRLHGAPMQWAAIFHKRDVRITKGTDYLKFYNSEQSINERILPCKVSCSLCGTPIADEGRRMWIAFRCFHNCRQATCRPCACRCLSNGSRTAIPRSSCSKR